MNTDAPETSLPEAGKSRAAAIAAAGGIHAARESGTLPRYINTTVSEPLVLGLLAQGVEPSCPCSATARRRSGRCYVSTRKPVWCGYMACAVNWRHRMRRPRSLADRRKGRGGHSIGPGALQALAASIVPASDGLGVWYLLGDETTEDEGPNMQQIPRTEQASFLKLYATMGQAYSLHTPLALPTALRRGLNTVDHPHRGGPFFLLLPMNVQPLSLQQFNLDELPTGAPPPLGAAAETGGYAQAVAAIRQAERIVVRVVAARSAPGPRYRSFSNWWTVWRWSPPLRSARCRIVTCAT